MPNRRNYEQFSNRLKQALSLRGIPANSPTELARQFGTRPRGVRVSAQAARKWLNAESIPTHDKLKALANWLGMETNWLLSGEGSPTTQVAHESKQAYQVALGDEELLRHYRKLNGIQQQAITEIITALATKQPRR